MYTNTLWSSGVEEQSFVQLVDFYFTVILKGSIQQRTTLRNGKMVHKSTLIIV